MAWLRVFVFALALVAALAETELETRAEQLIKDFQAIMLTGTDFGIPILEPASVPKIPVDVKVSALNAHCDATDLSIAGVSGFKFTKLTQREGTTTLDVAVELPDINVDGQYNINGKVKVGFIKVNMKSQGNLNVILSGLKGSASVDVTVNADNSLNVAALNVNDWQYNDITIDLSNVCGGGVTGKLVNKLINTLVPTFVKSNKAKINGIIESKGLPIINKYLDGVAGKKSVAKPLLSAEEQDWIVVPEVQAVLDQIAATIARSKPVAA